MIMATGLSNKTRQSAHKHQQRSRFAGVPIQSYTLRNAVIRAGVNMLGDDLRVLPDGKRPLAIVHNRDEFHPERRVSGPVADEGTG